MIYFIGFLVSFVACVVGRLCGLGGGVIIKPTLDAFNVTHMSIASISFLSSCTVLAMTGYSVALAVKKHEVEMDMKLSTALAAGSCIGGILGKSAFQKVSELLPDADTVGTVQAILMILMLIASLIFALKRNQIHCYSLRNPWGSAAIGFSLGMLSAFIGGGTGPINMTILAFVFSMSTKLAVVNSLYIILFSQLASLAQTLLSGNLPDFNPILFAGMVVFAIVGSKVGRILNKRLDETVIQRLFIVLMCLLLCMNAYNVVQYL